MNQLRREWIGVLAGLVDPIDPVRPVEALMRLLPHLDEFPDDAFTPDSARTVAVAKRYGHVPDFGVIYPALADWWRDHKPWPVALPAPSAPDWPAPTPEESEHVRKLAAAFRADTRAFTAERNAQMAQLQPGSLPRRQSITVSTQQLMEIYRDEVARGGRSAQGAAIRLRMLEANMEAAV